MSVVKGVKRGLECVRVKLFLLRHFQREPCPVEFEAIVSPVLVRINFFPRLPLPVGLCTHFLLKKLFWCVFANRILPTFAFASWALHTSFVFCKNNLSVCLRTDFFPCVPLPTLLSYRKRSSRTCFAKLSSKLFSSSNGSSKSDNLNQRQYRLKSNILLQIIIHQLQPEAFSIN